MKTCSVVAVHNIDQLSGKPTWPDVTPNILDWRAHKQWCDPLLDVSALSALTEKSCLQFWTIVLVAVHKRTWAPSLKAVQWHSQSVQCRCLECLREWMCTRKHDCSLRKDTCTCTHVCVGKCRRGDCGPQWSCHVKGPWHSMQYCNHFVRSFTFCICNW